MKTNLTERVGLSIKTIVDGVRSKLRHFTLDPSSTQLREVTTATQRYDAGEAEIDADQNLSPNGRFNALIALKKEHYAHALAWIEKNVDGLSKRIGIETASYMAAARLTRPTDAVARLTQELRFQEIRESVIEAIEDGDVDVVMRPIVLARVYAEGDAETRAAMETAPMQISITPAGGVTVAPLIPATIVEERAIAEAELATPGTVEQLRELQTLRDALAAIGETWKTALHTGTRQPLGVDDPIVSMAAGKK